MFQILFIEKCKEHFYFFFYNIELKKKKVKNVYNMYNM